MPSAAKGRRGGRGEGRGGRGPAGVAGSGSARWTPARCSDLVGYVKQGADVSGSALLSDSCGGWLIGEEWEQDQLRGYGCDLGAGRMVWS